MLPELDIGFIEIEPFFSGFTTFSGEIYILGDCICPTLPLQTWG